MADSYHIKPFLFSVAGTVIHGDQVGRTIGFPTANLKVQIKPEELSPGVYFGECYLQDKPSEKFSCLPYFGPRLIFGETINSFEVYIYDFDRQIYDQTLVVKISHKLRNPIDIKNLEDLQTQLQLDKQTGQTLFTRNAQ